MCTLTQIGLAQIERRLSAEGYVCEIYSHTRSSDGTVYGFVVYNADEDNKRLVCFDFGYTALGETECAALACVLRESTEVSVEDFPVLHLDDLTPHCNDCNLYAPC